MADCEGNIWNVKAARYVNIYVKQASRHAYKIKFSTEALILRVDIHYLNVI
jgi:hypothetical protein